MSKPTFNKDDRVVIIGGSMCPDFLRGKSGTIVGTEDGFYLVAVDGIETDRYLHQNELRAEDKTTANNA